MLTQSGFSLFSWKEAQFCVLPLWESLSAGDRAISSVAFELL